MPLATGQILNHRYRIVKLLGQGGFGAVYKAWDINLNGPCAVKENIETAPAAMAQFSREASLLFNLRHSALPKVFDAFSVSGQGQYLVMEYIEGEDLQQMLDRTGGPLSPAQLMPWIEQVCDALAYLHSQNPPVIHRDIKPANIRVMPQGQAVLVDFGIAKLYDPAQRTTLGARAVTPGFSPPEQYGMGGGTDARSDIYSLGATLYVMLAGQTLPESVEIMSGGAPPPLPVHRVNPLVSLAISQAIERAIQINRTARFASVAEFKFALHPVSIPPTVRPLQPAAAPYKPPAPAGKPAAQAPTQKTSRELTFELVPGVSITFVLVPAGVFGMGTALEDVEELVRRGADRSWLVDEQPQHRVELSEFWIGKTPVTVAQFAAFVDATGYETVNEEKQNSGLKMLSGGAKGDWERPFGAYEAEIKADHPVTQVSWEDAVTFCEWLCAVTKREIRLPLEAEWEKAARGTDERLYPWGDELPDINRCNFNDHIGDTTPVGKYSPQGDSPYGCVDMAGNVWEWCDDWYDPDVYARRAGQVAKNPEGPEDGENCVVRGGAWHEDIHDMHVSVRGGSNPLEGQEDVGFRCLMEA